MKMFAALVLCLLTFTVAASEPIFVEVSQPGEFTDAFVQRVAHKAVNHGEFRKVEMCGVINMSKWEDGSPRFELKLYRGETSHSCRAEVFPNTVASFHTHRADSRAVFSEVDYAFPGYLAVGNKLMYQAGRGSERRVAVNSP